MDAFTHREVVACGKVLQIVGVDVSDQDLVDDGPERSDAHGCDHLENHKWVQWVCLEFDGKSRAGIHSRGFFIRGHIFLRGIHLVHERGEGQKKTPI